MGLQQCARQAPSTINPRGAATAPPAHRPAVTTPLTPANRPSTPAPADPSYHAPAHYRAFRDYMVSFAPLMKSLYGTSADEGASLAPSWDSVIETSYILLDEAQCAATGLIPNW